MKGKIYSALVLSLFLAAAATATFAQGTGIRSTNSQFDRLLTRIETKADILKNEIDRIGQRQSNNTAGTGQLSEDLTALQQSATALHESFDASRPVRDDLTNLLRNASRIDQSLAHNRINTTIQTQWSGLKQDLTTLAGYGRVNWNWNAPVTPNYPTPTANVIPYSATDRQMRTLLSRIDMKTGIFRTQMDSALRADRSAPLSDRDVNGYVARFETSVDRLRQRFDSRQTAVTDATDVLMNATYIDQFMTRNRLNATVQAQWRNLKTDLSTLATYYRQSWNWSQTLPADNAGTGTGTGPGIGLGNFDRRLTGTYRLNTSLSEDPSTVVDRANIETDTQTNRGNSRQAIERRLRSPEMIAIDMNGQTVNMASSILPQVAFQADGVARSETNARGRTITTTATVDADGLIIDYSGERSNDFYVTFMPTNERRLKVTRRIYVGNNNQQITVSSVYDKIDNVARWASITTNTGVGQNDGVIQDSFVVPAGTRLNAELRSRVSSSPFTDRFTMEVTTPGQYRRAMISGRVIAEEANTRSGGRTRMLLAFDTIRLNDGRTYRFAGNVDAVTSSTGESIQVSNQTPTVRTQQQQNTGVGSILGALLGAISGAPIDQYGTAATSSGAVLVQRGEQFSLETGSQFMITAVVPR